MVARSVKKLFYTILASIGLVLALSALVLLAKTSNSAAELNRLQQVTLIIDGAGIVILVALLLGNIVRLFSDLRRNVPGARLKSRMVAAFIALALLPLSLVYYFSLQFLNRGIDSWFSVQVEQGLEDALSLSRAAMEIQKRNGLAQTLSIGQRLETISDGQLLAALARERQGSGALEIIVFAENNRIIALSSERAVGALPAPPTDEVLLQVRASRPYVSLDPVGESSYEVRSAVPLVSSNRRQVRVLQAVYPVTQRLSSMATSVDQSYTDYQRLVLLRGPLKSTFTLSLTVVLLVSALGAVYGAFFFSRRLVAPIQDLVAGTVAVAEGDLETELSPPPKDEIGVLVSSFNDMTRRLRAARDEAQLSRAEVELERANVEAILARLSTGVIALTADLEIRAANSAASEILAVDIDQKSGESLIKIADGELLLQQVVDVAQAHFAAGETEWREQIMLREEVGRRVITCACTPLPGQTDFDGGYVIVFDDITTLLEAQRDAAWGEVARRLAHEIKNPLTPIQLSAERLRRRYLDTMAEEDAKLLDRATHTIVQQVEAMKAMVNAFSDYARAPDMQLTRFELHRLIHEVVDLYRNEDHNTEISLTLSNDSPIIEADNGRVRQVLHNLIRNALEALAGQEDGKVSVTSEQLEFFGESAVQITVRDNGPGFQSGNVEQVFDPYVTSKPKGTGLGLAIVKKLIEEHAGTIEAGNLPDGGARVAAILPLNEKAREVMLRHAHRRLQTRRTDK